MNYKGLCVVVLITIAASITVHASGNRLLDRIASPLTFPTGNDNQGSVSAPAGKFSNQPVTLGAINPYTANATRIVNDLSIASVGENSLNWSRINNTRIAMGTQRFGTDDNWRHSFQWDFSYTAPDIYVDRTGVSHGVPPTPEPNRLLPYKGVINLVYPDGTYNTFTETDLYTGIYICNSSEVTDYIVLDGNDSITKFANFYNNYTGFRLITSTNQSYRFSLHQNNTFLLDTITDSKGQALTLSYYYPDNENCLLQKITEPGGRYLNIYYNAVPNSTGIPTNNNAYNIFYTISSVVSSDSQTVSYSYVTTSYAGTYIVGIHSNNCTYHNYDLQSVTYPDATSAAYTYQSYSYTLVDSGGTAYTVRGVSLLTAQDTHVSGLPKVQYNFWTQQAGYTAPPAGCVQSITELTTNKIISKIGLVVSENNSDAPVASFVDNTGYGYSVQAGGLLQQTSNILDNAGSSAYSSTAGTVTTTATFNYGTTSGTFSSTTTNPNAHNLTMVRSVLGHVLSRTWPMTHGDTAAPSESWTYNNAGYLLTYTDTKSHTTTVDRDANNLITKITYPDTTFETFTYGAFNEVATHVRRNGGTEHYTYYTVSDFGGVYNGLLKSIQDAEGGLATYTYDAHYHLATITNANGHTTTFAKDIDGRIVTITNPATTQNPTPTTVQFTYDNYGNVLTKQNEDGKIWTYTYDSFSRIKTVQDPVGRIVTNTYDDGAPDNANPIQVTNTSSGKTTAYTYLVNWGYKVHTVTTGYGTLATATTTYDYDADGNVAAITDPRGKVTHIYYDERDRTSSAVDPVSNTTTFYYDDASNLTDQITPDGTTHNTFDSMNRLLSSTDPKSKVVNMTYDPEGALKTYQESGGASYSYTYDHDERQLTMQYPDATTEVYTYYAFGNLHTYKTRDNKTETLACDERERQIGSSWNDGVTPAITTSYDNASYISSVSNSNSTVSYTYTDAGETKTETQLIAGLSDSKQVGYTYNTDGSLDTLTYPDSTVLHYGYDSRNQLTSITQGTALVTSYGYDSAGNRTSKTLANGVLSTLTYDDVERLTSTTDVAPVPTAGTILQQYSYGYDGMNRRKYVKKKSGLGDVYGYDTRGQLTSVLYDATNPDTATPTNPLRTVGYTFDDGGNRTLLTDKLSTETTAFTLSYTPNANNQYTQVGAAVLGYDGRGNLASYQEHGATQTHTVTCAYDAQNHLLSASNNFDSTNLTQVYDSLGRCVKRVENGTTSYFVYDLGWNLVAEYNSDGTQRARYVGGAATDEILTKTDSAGIVLYYSTDGLGSVTALTSSSGAMVESYTYDVYGNPSIKDGSGISLWGSFVGNRFLFTGREYLASLGVYDYRTRIYDPYLGRFWQPDSIGHAGDSNNLHRYCGNDPVNNTDPLGTDGFSATIPGPSGGYFIDPFGDMGYFQPWGQASTIPGQFSPNFMSPGLANLLASPGGAGFGDLIEAARVAHVKAEYPTNSSYGGVAPTVNVTITTVTITESYGPQYLSSGARGVYYAAEGTFVAGMSIASFGLFDYAFGGVVAGGALTGGATATPTGVVVAAAAAAPGAVAVVNGINGQGAIGLTQSEASAVSKINNIIGQNLKSGPKGDISGAVSDMVGNPIPKLGGGSYDHIQDLGNILRGLRNNADKLQNATGPPAVAARQRALQTIQEIESNTQGAGL